MKRGSLIFGKLFGGPKGTLSPVLRWALLCGVMIHLFGFVAFRVISNPLPESEKKAPFVAFLPEGLLDEDQVLMEQAALFDTAPLFIPTKWSGYSLEMPIVAVKPDRLFELYEPEIELAENLKIVSLDSPNRYALKSATDLSLVPREGEYASFGIGSMRQTPISEEWEPVVRVIAFNGGREIVEEPSALGLPVDEFEEVVQLDGPIRLGLKSSNNGILLIPPFVIDSSGNAGLDRSLADWFSRPIAIAGFPRGYVEVEIFL